MLNPHFKLVDSQAWIARRDGKLVGRIFAQIYKDGVTPSAPRRRNSAAWIPSRMTPSSTPWLETAEDLAARARRQTIHGPFSPSVNGECGMLVEGFDATPMIFMPWNPALSCRRSWKTRGYNKARDLISYRYDVKPEDRTDKPGIVARPEWRNRLKIRTIDLKTIAKEAEIIVDIFNDAWSENWGFVPFTYDEFMSTADGMKLVDAAGRRLHHRTRRRGASLRRCSA